MRAMFLLRHVGEAALIIICISALEALMNWLFHPSKPLLFDTVPLKYMFHAMDVAVLAVLGYQGVVGLWNLRDDEDKQE